ncbi:MAG: isopeptide-forming domain-containing fimbrial protein [Coriobacteriia bacterium]|nr:isopeptide-forming domain-containing fimbrial protein [Coriobacteriia bacterium]
MQTPERHLSRRGFLMLGGAATLAAVTGGGLQLVLPGPRDRAFAATRHTIPSDYADRMPADAALMNVNKKTLVKATWSGASGKVLPSPSQPSVDMYLINKGSSSSAHTYTNFLTMEFADIGQIGGRKLNATVTFTSLKIDAHVGSTTTGEDTAGNYTCVALMGPNLIAIGASYTSSDPTYGYGFRGARTTQVRMQVTWADTGKAVELPFFAAISDIDAPSSTGATWYNEGWTADSGFTGDFWTWPSCYLVSSGNTFKSPKTTLTSGNDRWFKAGVIAPLTSNTMTSSFLGGGCTTNLTLYSSYAGLQAPVKTVDERTYATGETLEFTITQKMGCFFEDTMDCYTSLVLEDVLPDGLTFLTASMNDGSGKSLASAGTQTFDKDSRTLRFTFSSSWLSSTANYAGQDLVLTVRCKANEPAKHQATLTNRSTTYFSGYAYQSNQVQVRVIQPCTVTVTKRIKAEDVNWAHGEPTFTFALEGTGHDGKEHAYHATVAFRKKEGESASGEWLEQSTVIKAAAGTYVLSEEPCLRYQVDSVTTNGTVKGKAAELDLVELVHGTATFTNRKTAESGLSDVVSVSNHIGS